MTQEIHSIATLSLKSDKKGSDEIERTPGILKIKFYRTILVVYVVSKPKQHPLIKSQ